MKKEIKIILLSMIGTIGYAQAQTPAVIASDKTGWHKIAETTVDFKKDHDEVKVVGADRFAAIQFKVEDAPIDLISLEVYYENGYKQDIVVNTPIYANTKSRVIDLNGGERSLDKIVLVYKTLPNSKDDKAHVEIWGIKTNADKKMAQSSSPSMETSLIVSDKKGWHKIGERIVDFVKDHDEFIVIGADRFGAIKFKVTEAPIQLMKLEVYFESGDNQNILVESPVMAGTESKVFNLNGGEREVKKIVFHYKTLPNQTAEKAIVELWGLKTNVVVK